jgi:ubiquinone/menaquinone biosynthesis C-methylase UbiE
MTVHEAYNWWAATYDSDRNLTRDLDQAVTRATLGSLRCSSILELGCGTGKNTELLAQLGRRVYSLDFSEQMISQAKTKLRADNVSFLVADLTRRWPCRAKAVDLAVCNLVLEHIADLDFIFSEASRVLVKGGRFFVCELHPFRQYQGAKATFQHGQEQTLIPAFVHHISHFLDAAQRAGFTLQSLKEWWHEEDQRSQADEQVPPRLVSVLFEK